MDPSCLFTRPDCRSMFLQDLEDHRPGKILGEPWRNWWLKVPNFATRKSNAPNSKHWIFCRACQDRHPINHKNYPCALSMHGWGQRGQIMANLCFDMINRNLRVQQQWSDCGRSRWQAASTASIQHGKKDSKQLWKHVKTHSLVLSKQTYIDRCLTSDKQNLMKFNRLCPQKLYKKSKKRKRTQHQVPNVFWKWKSPTVRGEVPCMQCYLENVSTHIYIYINIYTHRER